MIADNFDSRTRANMDVALERACALLPAGAEQHENRRYIAGHGDNGGHGAGKPEAKRIATSIRLKRLSGRGPDIVRQPFHGFRFQGIGNRLRLDSIAFRAFERPHL
jgi:hypothetical protein